MRELQGRKESLHALAFSADNRFLVIGGTAGRVDVWNLADPTAKRPLFPRLGTTVADVWIDPAGQEIVAAELSAGSVARYRFDGARAGDTFLPEESRAQAEPQITSQGDGVVCGVVPARYELASGSEAVWTASLPQGHQPRASAYAIAPDDQRLAAGEAMSPRPYVISGYRVSVYDMTRRTEPRVFGEVSGFAKRLVWAPDGKHLAVAIDTRVLVWSADGKPVSTFEGPGPLHVIGLAFHPSGRWLAAADNAGAVRLLDAATWTEARCFTWGVGKARSVCFSPDGTLAAVGGDTGKVVVWDVDV